MVVEFHLMESLTDPQPTIVKREHPAPRTHPHRPYYLIRLARGAP
jgi:hypothetical protein